jgi:hypothetical protein
LKVGALGVIAKFLNATGDFNELGFEVLELLSIVFGVSSFLGRNR